MDSASDALEIKQKSLELGHVPLIDVKYQSDNALKEELEASIQRLDFSNEELPQQVRYRERSASSLFNGRFSVRIWRSPCPCARV